MPVSKLIKDQVSVIPEKPGVYKYYDADGCILYIGKAKNLKKRVRSYFTRGKQSAKLKILVSKIHKINYTLTDSEFDAFLLENNLIKKHQPRYNVELKDGKSYPFICIKNERFPRVFSTRQVVRDGSVYFGPYASVTAMNTVLDVIRKQFTIRSCSLNLTEENIQKGKYRVCLDYHINLCKGPCEGLQSESDYMKDIANIRKILNGNTGVVIRLLNNEMQQAAGSLDFEKAQELKAKIESLEKFQARSTIVNPRINNADVFALYTKGEKVFISYMRVVNGAIIQTFSVAYKKKLDESEEEILKLAIVDLKERFRSNSKEIIVPFRLEMEGPSGISPFSFTSPKKGDKKKLLDLCYKNAMYFAKSQIVNNERKSQKNYGLLENIQKDLDLPVLPEHIECIDNSHIQGHEPVSSVVVFKNARPSKKDYRLFNLNTVKHSDDYGAMKEVVERRYRRLADNGEQLPGLLLIDGGKGQLNTTVKVLEELHLTNKIAIRSIAKRLEEIYQPGDPYPLHINKKSQTLRVLQHLRDEAHRFAINHHRKRRMKSGLDSILNEIPGIGKKSITNLLTQFRSVQGIREAGFEEIKALIGPDKARKVFNYITQSDQEGHQTDPRNKKDRQ